MNIEECTKNINCVDDAIRKLDEFNGATINLIDIYHKTNPDLCCMLENSIRRILEILKEFSSLKNLGIY